MNRLQLGRTLFNNNHHNTKPIMTLTATDKAHKKAINELYAWSLNCESNGDPWPVFLDLSNYSIYGKVSHPDVRLGHLEKVMLAKALLAFESHGHGDVHAWIEEALGHE